VRVFGLPSLLMWGGHGEDRWCGLCMVWNGGTVGIYQEMWFVMLKYDKDEIVGVDTPGWHVPPRIQYGMDCWLIRKALVSLSCWMSRAGMAIPKRPQGARRAWGYSIVPNMGKP
jgi:hypothetical protein